jgi:uncharacterized protein (TIGR00369 family)
VNSQNPDGSVTVTEGEFAGWSSWARDRFESVSGPYYYRIEDGAVRCAFRAQTRHLNGQDTVHGGCLMTFADFCLFAIAAPILVADRAVTVTMASEFIEAAREGDFIEGSGEILRAGRSLIFVRGVLRCGERMLLNFSGTLKRVRAA